MLYDPFVPIDWDNNVEYVVASTLDSFSTIGKCCTRPLFQAIVKQSHDECFW